MLNFTLPLYVMLPRKTKVDRKMILNLNLYRNTHRMTLGIMKNEYTELVLRILDESNWDKKKFNKVELTLTYYHGNNRRVDKSNPLCIIEKFMCDALTYAGVWDDDDSSHIPITIYKWGGVDKNRPRCEVTIKEI